VIALILTTLMDAPFPAGRAVNPATLRAGPARVRMAR
jgi:hypothetical protein